MSSEDKCCKEGQCREVVTAEDYARAERYLPGNVGRLAFGLEAVPNWTEEGDSFWYKVDTREGKRFMFVDPRTGTQRPAFDHVRLAAALSRAMGKGFTHQNLPFEKIEYARGLAAITFTVGDATWRCDLSTYEICRTDPKLSPEPTAVRSPDGKWDAYCKDHDLYVRSTSNGEEVRLTSDGQDGFEYAKPLTSPIVAAGLLAGEQAAPWLKPAIVWSKDSKKLLSYQIDSRGAGMCYLVQSVPLDGTKRPKVFSYVYPLPGDERLTTAQPVIIDIEKRSVVRIGIDPVELFYYGAPHLWTRWVEGDRKSLVIMVRSRGSRELTFYNINVETGEARRFLTEEAPNGGDYPEQFLTDDGKTFIWASQRDGWTHLYSLETDDPQSVHQITKGPWVVREIKFVDQVNRIIYFTAGGREPGIDPYYRLLYRVRFDGSDLTALALEDGDHEIACSPSGNYFVDTYSRVDQAPVTVLRSADGSRVQKLEEADIGLLLATGWKYPERFCVKARDGKTDIYGVIFRPSRFEASKSYPVIEGNYSGPHTIRTPKMFGGGGAAAWNYWQDTALAELGFIVVNVDGLGMNYRSREFQDYSFRNLGDAGLPDHIAAFKQLADRYPEMDLARVGIYGASAGGYAACHAILAYPEFFKVAVVWAGNHDHRIDKTSWVEKYMGLYGPHYIEQANPTIASNLIGKLLIMHGDMDENVPPAASMQLVDALIKANKDFDYLCVPNGVHATRRHPYVIRKRWDYFVRHLMGAEPPKQYVIHEG